MNRRVIISLLLAIQITNGIAQDYKPLDNDMETEISNKVDTLRQRGIEHALIYRPNSYMEIIHDPAGFYSRAFLIWLEKNKTYVQKFVISDSICLSKGPLIYTDTILRNYLLLNIDTFFYAEVLPYTYKEVYQDVNYYKSVLETGHQTSTSFVFYSTENSVSKFIDHFWLEKQSLVFGENLNFQANQISILNDLRVICERVLGRL